VSLTLINDTQAAAFPTVRFFGNSLLISTRAHFKSASVALLALAWRGC